MSRRKRSLERRVASYRSGELEASDDGDIFPGGGRIFTHGSHIPRYTASIGYEIHKDHHTAVPKFTLAPIWRMQ